MRLKLKLVDDTGTEHWTAGGMCHLSYSPRPSGGSSTPKLRTKQYKPQPL